MPISSNSWRIIDGSVLSFRENAELSKYCTLLVGCSSGISWLCTSEWAKQLPMIQLINPRSFWFASFIRDHEHWGLSTELIIEMASCREDSLVDCILMTITDGFSDARIKYHETIPLNFDSFGILFLRLLYKGQFIKGVCLMRNTFKQYGFKSELILSYFPKSIMYGLSKITSSLFRRISYVFSTK